MPPALRRVVRPRSLSGEEDVRAAYDAHGGELFRFLLRGTRDQGAAQDLVQEVFLRAWRAREGYDPRVASLRVWLFSIARHALVDHVRARAVRPWHDTSRPVELAPEQAADDQIADLMQGWLVEEALQRIGAEHRRALEEVYLADRPYADVAAELGVPESTLRSRVFYGLKALRVVMEEMEVAP